MFSIATKIVQIEFSFMHSSKVDGVKTVNHNFSLKHVKWALCQKNNQAVEYKLISAYN